MEQSKVKWCLILGTNPFNEKDADWLINEFANENYQKIGDRPIIYLFNINKDLLSIVKYIKKNSKNYKKTYTLLKSNKMKNYFQFNFGSSFYIISESSSFLSIRC